MLKFNRPHVCAALILCTPVAFAQDASAPVVNASTGSSTANALPAPSSDTSTAPEMETATAKKPQVTDAEQSEGFMVPGGMGYAPLDFTPGQGMFDRRPLTFSTTIQQGYDDNINATSGSPLQAPVKGSLVTIATEGMELLLAQSRVALSLSANAGAQYYWSRDNNPLLPTGGLNLVFGYKLTPRAQFSAIVNGLYTNQPTQSMVNGLTQSSGKGCFVGNSKFDLLYRWAPRFSTDTSYSLNGTQQQDSALNSSDYITQTFGQSLRYDFSRLVTGVLEGRYAQRSFSNPLAGSISKDTQTYSLLVGADLTLSRLFSGSFRVGDSTQKYDAPGISNSSAPYGEATLNYLLTKNTAMSLDGRYGYDDGMYGQDAKSARGGLSLTHVFTPKLRGSLGVNYNHTGASSSKFTATSASVDALDFTAGTSYALTQKLSLFGNVTHTRRTSPNALQEMTKNVYYLGATYQY